MQVQQEDSAVRIVVCARRSLCRTYAMQVFLAANECGAGEVGSDEIALDVHVGINGVVDQMPALAIFNGNVVGRGARPDGSAIHCVIRFPDAKVMTPRYDGAGFRQGVRVVLNSAVHVKPGHGQRGVVGPLRQQVPGHHQLPCVCLHPTSALEGRLQIVVLGDENEVHHVALSPFAIKDTWRQIVHHGIQAGSGLAGSRQLCRQYGCTTVDLRLDLGVLQNSAGATTRKQEDRSSRQVNQTRDGHLGYHAPGVRDPLDLLPRAQADSLTVHQFDGIEIEHNIAPDSEKAPVLDPGDRTLRGASGGDDDGVSDPHVLLDGENEGIAGASLSRRNGLSQPKVDDSPVRNDQAGGTGRILGEETLRQEKQQQKYVCGYRSVIREMHAMPPFESGLSSATAERCLHLPSGRLQLFSVGRCLSNEYLHGWYDCAPSLRRARLDYRHLRIWCLFKIAHLLRWDWSFGTNALYFHQQAPNDIIYRTKTSGHSVYRRRRSRAARPQATAQQCRIRCSHSLVGRGWP